MKHALTLALLLFAAALPAWNALMGPLDWNATKDDVRAAVWPIVTVDQDTALVCTIPFNGDEMDVWYNFAEGRLCSVFAVTGIGHAMRMHTMFDNSYLAVGRSLAPDPLTRFSAIDPVGLDPHGDVTHKVASTGITGGGLDIRSSSDSAMVIVGFEWDPINATTIMVSPWRVSGR